MSTGPKDLQPEECYAWRSVFTDAKSGRKSNRDVVAYRGKVRKLCALCGVGGEPPEPDEE